jgi:hypothetical protein
MKIYDLKTCESLIQRYVDQFSGECIVIEEGVLGLGTVLLTAHGKKAILIKEIFLNAWSSGHTIKMYNKIPKKYEKYPI